MLNNLDNFDGKQQEERIERISEVLDKMSETTSPLTDNDLEDYCRYFNLKPEELMGNKILDLGSGKLERFSKEASVYNAEVVSLNPALQQENVRDWAKEEIIKDGALLEWQKKSVAGRSQELPFKDKSFDKIVSLFSSPYYIDSKNGKLNAVKEMARVIKDNGIIYIGPKTIENEQNIEESILNEEASSWLVDSGYVIEEIEDGGIVIKKNGKTTTTK